MSQSGAVVFSNKRQDIILSYLNGYNMKFDLCTKMRDSWMAGVDVIANLDKTANLTKGEANSSDKISKNKKCAL